MKARASKTSKVRTAQAGPATPRVWAGIGSVLFALLVWALALAPSAQAQTSYGHVGEIGGSGSASGEFAEDPSAGRVAVHQATGRVFVADTGNDRIQVFEPVSDESDPEFPLSFVEEFGNSTDTHEPVGVAVDQQTADLFVVAVGTNTNAIVKFNPASSGTPSGYSLDSSFESPPEGSNPGEVGDFGAAAFSPGFTGKAAIAVDNSGGASQGEILLLDTGHGLIQRYGPSGWDGGAGFIRAFDGSASGQAFDSLFDLAVGSNGEVLVVDTESGSGETQVRIERFSPDGSHLALLASWQIEFADAVGAILAANPDTGEVFIGRNEIDPDTFESHARILQLVDDELFGEIQLPEGRDAGNILGMGIRSELPGRLYPLASDSNGLTGDGTPWLQVYDQADPPECGPVAVSGVGAHQATFESSVNPMADSGTWRFEFREQGQEDWPGRVPVPDGDLDGGTDPEAVGPETASDLEPNTTYEARTMAFNPAPCIEPPAETFTTDPVAPVAETGDAHSVSAFSATLGATIDPQNSETEYVFEYGTDESYGNVTETLSAGDGRDPTEVFAEVDGLDPSTTYHFRVVARNVEFPGRELADTGGDSSFQTRPASDSRLPERGYELVSRVDNGGVIPNALLGSFDGNAFLYTGWVPTPGAENGVFTFQRMTRNADGSWSPDPHMAQAPVDPDLASLGKSAAPLLSGDLSTALFPTGGSYHPMDQNREGGNTGRDTYLRSTETGDLTWVSRDPRPNDDEPQTDPANADRYQHLSPDGSIAIFGSSRRLLDSHGDGTGGALYKWDSGELTLVSQNNDGENIRGGLGSGLLTRNTVSPEGDRIVFASGFIPATLHVRIDDERTVEIGGGDDTDLAGNATYFGADSETTEVLYTREDTDTGIITLYLFDVEAETSTEIASPVPPDARRRVFGISDDADRIYFNSEEVLAEGATQGSPNLYLAERSGSGQEHVIRFISPLHPDDVGIKASSPRLPRPQAANDVDIDSTGSILAFTSRAELVPGRRNGGFPQVYIYDAEVDRLYCASCPADGSVAEGRGDIGAKTGSGDRRVNFQASPHMRTLRNVTESGSVFFQSTARVLPADTNGLADTYEWRGGELRLISSGRGNVHQVFVGASADGETVFFLSNRDWVDHGGVSNQVRIYAARVGGGFTPPEPEADCVGEECRGEATTQPDPSIGSSELRRELGEPQRADRALRVRCARIVRHARASRARAIALVRIARRSQGARRRVAVRRARAFAKKTRALRVRTQHCRRALR